MFLIVNPHLRTVGCHLPYGQWWAYPKSNTRPQIINLCSSIPKAEKVNLKSQRVLPNQISRSEITNLFQISENLLLRKIRRKILMIFQRTNWQNFVYKVTFSVQADLLECCCISVPAVINNIYRSTIPAQKCLLEQCSELPTRSGTTTPLLITTGIDINAL